MKKLVKRFSALCCCLALLSFLSLPAWAEIQRPTMAPIDWDGYIADPNYLVVGEGESVSFSPGNANTEITGLTMELYHAGETEWTVRQALRAEVTPSGKLLTLLPEGTQTHSSSTRYASAEEMETQAVTNSAGRASGYFGDFQGRDHDALPSVSWEVAYDVTLYLISEAWYPSSYFLSTGVLPSFYESEPMSLEEAMREHDRMAQEGVRFSADSRDGLGVVVTVEGDEEHEEGTFEVFVPGTVISLTGGGDSYYKTVGYSDIRRDQTINYYYVDPLPQAPGVYAIADVEVRDSYHEERTGAEKTFVEATNCVAEYNEISSLVFDRVNELADFDLKLEWLGTGDFDSLKPPTKQQEPIVQNEVITDPPDKPNEEFTGTAPINKIIITGAGGGIAATGAIAAAAGDSQAGTKKKREDEEDEEDESVYRMKFTKNFGNFLKKGEEPKYLYAWIVEIKKSGQEIERDDLTKRIVPYSPDGSLVVEDKGMVEGRHAVTVAVPKDGDAPVGEVSFELSGPGGVFTQSILFQLTEAQIVFAQDNMGLPANKLKFAQEEQDLEEGEQSRFREGAFLIHFLVKGLGDKPNEFPKDKVKVKAVLEKESTTDTAGNLVNTAKGDKHGMPYSLTVRPDPKDADKGIFEAEIREILDYELPAGTTEGIAMHITAEYGNPGDKDYEKTEGFFSLFRIHLGLSVTLDGNHVGCYMQLRPERKGLEKEKIKATDLEPCFTEGSALLYLYRRSDMEIIRKPVLPEVKITVKEVKQDRWAHIGDAGSNHQAMVDQLEIKALPTKNLRSNGALRIQVACTKGAMDPPIRLLADMEFTVKYKSGSGEKEASCKIENVLLHSQPCRESKSVEEDMRLLKNDAKITETLEHIRDQVYDRYMDNLAALYNLCDRMLDGYDSHFGYDENQVYNVKRIWVGFVEGTFAGANADAEPVTWADELNACYAFMQGLRDNTGILGRIAMGVMTAGYSEYVFTTMTLAEEMQKAVFSCTGDKEFGFWDGVVMGVKEFEKQILIEYAMKGVTKGLTMNITPRAKLELSNTMSRLGRKYQLCVRKVDRYYNQNSPIYRWANKGFKGCKNYVNSTAAAMKNSIETVEKRFKDAWSRSEGKIAKTEASLTPAERIKLNEEYIEAMQDGMRKVRAMEKAQRRMETAVGEDLKIAKEQYRKLANEVWTNKNALKQLQNVKGEYAPRLRAQFNHYRENLLDTVQLEALDDIARETGIPRENLYVMNASNGVKTEYYKGNKVPGDRDISFKQKVLSDRSKDLTINQSMGQDAVARRLYRKMNGCDAPSIEEARAFMKGKDVTYVHPEGDSAVNYVFEHNLDGYEDLSGMVGMKTDGTMDKSLLGKKLHNLQINRASVSHKGKEWLVDSKNSVSAAANIEAEAALLTGAAREAKLAEAKYLRYIAQGQKAEGIRQMTKQVEKIIIPRRVKWYSTDNGGLPDQFMDIQALGKRVEQDISPDLFEHILKRDYGMDLNQYCDYVAKYLE